MRFEERVQLGKESSMLVWYPRVKKLQIPQIKTEVVKAGHKPLYDLLVKENPLPKNISDELNKAMDRIGKFPMFMRTDQASGKHNWERTCYLKSRESFDKNLAMLLEEHEMQNMAGELGYDAIIFRELLDLETAFTCFYGNFPINKEVRCFIKDGKIQDIRNYWIRKAVDEGEPEDKDWESKLAKLKKYSKKDLDEIKRQLALVCDEFSEYWSADFAKTKNGIWYLIDMARGEVSYHQEEIIWENK